MGYLEHLGNWGHLGYRGHNKPLLYLIEGPSVPVVALAELKTHMRVDFPDDDDQITAMEAAAEAELDGRDGILGRALMAQTWDMKFAGFYKTPSFTISLPPLLEVISISYYDHDGASQTMDPADYIVTGINGAAKGRVILQSGASWPVTANRPDAVSVRFRAGYVDTSQDPPSGKVPAPIIQAIKMRTSELYANRESTVLGQSVAELPRGYQSMIMPLRVW